MNLIIVLGCSTIENHGNTWEPVGYLLDRLNGAYQLYQDLTNVFIMVCGGYSLKNKLAESQVMRQYLEKKNIPKENIIEEDASLSTVENCVFAYNLIKKLSLNIQTMYILSSEFHIPRAEVIFNFFSNRIFHKSESGQIFRESESQIEIKYCNVQTTNRNQEYDNRIKKERLYLKGIVNQLDQLKNWYPSIEDYNKRQPH